MLECLKINGNIRFKDHSGNKSLLVRKRNMSTRWCIKQADSIYKWDDFPKIKISTTDYERNNNIYSYSKFNTTHKTVPDFIFHEWMRASTKDNYNELIEKICNAGAMQPTINKAVWIGSEHIKLRRRLYDMGQQNMDYLDIKLMKWKQFTPNTFMTLEEQVMKYSMIIDIEGLGYSGRLKLLLWSNRPVLLVDRPYKEYFYDKLKPWVHYIPVKRDLSDLVEKTKWCINNKNEAAKIAKNALEFSKENLTRNASFKRWDELIQKHIDDVKQNKDKLA